ncbi:alpha/beta-hydrolase [Teratosphaeria nubilosa]|uniref:Alpha/beta-hydrolase n=1 Tax=Teratosphaeria nubilosa TaxID=161662 RepID=A0A6G1KZC6_9PEZI|nr:alpha/beta-hydrolase [Teratosphaeria nubilosa]
MLSLFKRLGLLSATAVAGYAIFLGLLLTPRIQRFALYAHKINTLFLGDDLYDGEAFGFVKGQVVPFWLSEGHETLFGWCVLANDVYARNRLALIAEVDRRHGSVGGLEGTKAFGLLQRSDARVVVSFHGNAGHLAQTLRTSSYRLLVSQPNTHVLAIDYRGFGLSSGSPTEAGLIADGTALLDWLMNVVGVPPERIVILGQSLGTAVGSAVALNFAEPGSGLIPAEAKESREPVVFKGVVLVAPFSSLPSLLLTYRIGGILPILLPLRPFPWLGGMLTAKVEDQWRTAERLAAYYRAVAATPRLLESGDGKGSKMGSLQIFHSRRDRDISVAQTGMICERVFEGEEGKGLECVNGSVETGVLDVEGEGRFRVRFEVLEFGGHNRIVTHTPVAIGVLRAFEDLWD